MKKKQKYTLIDLFSGVGGFHIGFLESGKFELKLSVDNSKDCTNFHNKNFPEIPYAEMDVSKINKKFYAEMGINEVDVLIGGPPCQGFSTIGNRVSSDENKRGIYDKRNDLILHFVDQINILQPKIFVMENVRGLLTYQKGDFFENIHRIMKKKLKNYTFDFKLLNVVEYGVPQNRERTFVLGNRLGLPNEFPKSDHSEKDESKLKYKTVLDAFSGLYDSKKEFKNHTALNHGPINIERYKLIPEGGRLPESTLPKHLYRKNFGNTFKRLHRNKPSLTMVPGHNAFPLHPWLNRSLTVREAARIQTFPDYIEFTGNRQVQCIQVGNAVPPLMGTKWALHISKLLDKNEKK